MADMTLADRIYEILNDEHDQSPVATGTDYPVRDAQPLTDFELDCLDWGIVFGMAYGFARAENPTMTELEVRDEALTAAREAYMRWGGDAIFTGKAFWRDRALRPASEQVA